MPDSTPNRSARKRSYENAFPGTEDSSTPKHKRGNVSTPTIDEVITPSTDQSNNNGRENQQPAHPDATPTTRPVHGEWVVRRTPIRTPVNFCRNQSNTRLVKDLIKKLDKREKYWVTDSRGNATTLGLLMGSCSWLAEYKKGREMPIERVRIFYATQFHGQITKAIKEYDKLPFYREGSLKHNILGSRKMYCINSKNDTNKSNNDVDAKCEQICASEGGCSYRNEYNTKYSKHEDRLRGRIGDSLHPKSAFDIEDFKDAAKNIMCCPYFAARTLTTGVDVIFCPYHYLIHPDVRSSMTVGLDNAIVILDVVPDMKNNLLSKDGFTLDNAAARNKRATELFQERFDMAWTVITTGFAYEWDWLFRS